MITKLFNPFKFIAGSKSLVLGILIILATSCIGYFSNIHFPDLISIKPSPDFPIWYFIIQALSNWFVFSTILYLMALAASPSSVRIVDVFGTQAFARFPYLIVSFIGFSGSSNRFNKYMLSKATQSGEQINISTVDTVIAVSLIIISLLLLIWLVTLMYNAFKVSANLKGPKSIVLFIIAFIVSFFITNFISRYLITNFS